MAVGTMRVIVGVLLHPLLQGWWESDACGLEDLSAHASRFGSQTESFLLMLHFHPLQRFQVTQHVRPFRRMSRGRQPVL